ncbi:MAG: hypothetical protein JEY91_18060, partial [Spirochaetaceae bacterium]|nr:hypothetical protein [Spirochaetaceae bacterium]
ILLLTFSLLPRFIFSSIHEINGYKLEINEKNGMFSFFKMNSNGEYISVVDDDSSNSRISIYDNNGFYALGDTFRYRRVFKETDNGGIFYWTSREITVEETIALDVDGYLKIDFSITNTSTKAKSIGLKILLDTTFESEDSFYLKQFLGDEDINSEYEVDNPENLLFWTSGIRNDKGAALMSFATDSTPSRILFGNWDILNDADYYYRAVAGRNFNNPPYSINDAAVLYLYSPKDILPQNNLTITVVFRAVTTVSNHDEIIFNGLSAESIIVPDEKETEAPVQPVSQPRAQQNPITEEKVMPVKETEKEPEVEEIPLSEDTPEIVEKEKEVPEIVDGEIESSVSEKSETDVGTELLLKKLEIVDEIQDIIETLSLPGILWDENLSLLEDLIKKLEEIDSNED